MGDSRFGTVGRPTRVVVNAFRLNWSSKSLVYHYAVRSQPFGPGTVSRSSAITPEWPNKSGVVPKISKQKGIEVIQRLQTSLYPNIFTSLGAFDGKGNLFSFVQYNFGGPSISFDRVPLDADSERRKPKTVKIILALVRTVNISLLRGLLEGRDDSSLRDETSDAGSCLNMLNMFVQAQPRRQVSLHFSTTKHASYVEHRDASLYKGNSFYVPPTGSPGEDIDPLRLWNGFFQSVRPAINEIIVNVDVTAGVVMPGQPLVQAACSFARCRDASGLLHLQHHEFKKLRAALKGLKVAVHIEGQPKRRARPIKDLVSDVGAIEFDGPEGMTNVAEHFYNKYKVNVYKGALGIKIGQGEHFPITVCHVETQLYKPKLGPNQVTALHRFMPPTPRDRLDRIIGAWGSLGHSQSEFLRAAKIEVDRQPMSVEARILEPRTIAFGARNEREQFDLARLNSGSTGVWDVMHKRLMAPEVVQMMVVNFTGVRATDTMTNFIRELCKTMEDRGMTIKKVSPLVEGKPGEVEQTLQYHGKQHLPNLILAFLPAEAEEIYNQVKRFGDITQGIATQCIRWREQLFDQNNSQRGGRGGHGGGGGGRKMNWSQYQNNLILKINGKLGGVNWFSADNVVRMFETTRAMVIGADVSHPAPGSTMPSIASMVSSIDSKATRYVASVRVQQSRMEAIQDYGEMFDVALVTFYKRNKFPPGSIYVFRDGVSEGEFERVRQAEFQVIKQLTMTKYKELGLPSPKVTFIIVGKRHHFRFFPEDRQDADRSGNCRSGFVVDRRITHPIYRDFYLQSQAGLKGTSVPGHYTVLEDENLGLNMDRLQEVSYSLCHCYSRATRAVKIPAPVYYADLSKSAMPRKKRSAKQSQAAGNIPVSEPVTVSVQPSIPSTADPPTSTPLEPTASGSTAAGARTTSPPPSPPASSGPASSRRARPPGLIGQGSSDIAVAAPTVTPGLTEAHVEAIGVKRPNFGTGGTATKVLANFCPIKLNIHEGRKGKEARKSDFYWYQYDAVISPSLSRRASRILIDRIQNGKGSSAIFDKKSLEDKKNRIAYDGEKILYAPRRLSLGEKDDATITVAIHESQIGRPAPRLYEVRLRKTTEINPESVWFPSRNRPLMNGFIRVLNGLISGVQSSDVSVAPALNAINVVFGMKAMSELNKPTREQQIFARGRSLFSAIGKKDLGEGYQVWRGYFQSARPGIGRLLLNVDTAVALMYAPGPLIGLCLQFFRIGGPNPNPNLLSPQHGLTAQRREDLQVFLVGLEVEIAGATPGRPHRRGIVNGLTRQGASHETFVNRDNQQMTVADYFMQAANQPLNYPHVLCVTVGSESTKIPLERCTVPPGSFMKKEIPGKFLKEFTKYASQKPQERLAGIKSSLLPEGVLDHQGSEYLKAFGLGVASKDLPITVDARVLRPPTLTYGEGLKGVVNPAGGQWNMMGKKFFKPVTTLKCWMMVIYESRNRFTDEDANRAARDLMSECSKLGIQMEDKIPYLKYMNGQGNIEKQLKSTGEECRGKKGFLPSLIVVVIPTGGAMIYKAVKYTCDVKFGVATQCLKAPNCKGANSQYWANVCLKINGKLNGINVIIKPDIIPFLSDPNNPSIIMGADVTHPAPGPHMKSMPSYASVVASLDSASAKYMAALQVQARKEMITGLREMSKELLESHMKYKQTVERSSQERSAPKRLIFYRDGVSEGEFSQVLSKELPLLRLACKDVGISPKITFVIVGKRHHARFFPQSSQNADKSGNCQAGTVIDRDVCHPVEFDFYLQSHAGILGTSRSAHYSVLFDENNFQADSIQALSFALCHLFARSTRSVSLPAPVYYAHLVCGRAKNHYDPSETLPTPGSGRSASGQTSNDPLKPYRDAFKRTHINQMRRMYFL
ncbi:Piwi-domain-containing protein [Marasmius fiardii PR-910]|nr:Piwi-domain-containing protein [Marasmius fiardii PR-910]